jgi:hypothetical protein
VRAESGFGGEFRPHRLGVGVDVALEQFVEFVVAVRQQDGLTVRVATRATGAAEHLVDLQRIEWHHSTGGAVVATPVPDDDATAGRVHPGGEGGRGGHDLDQAVTEGVLDQRAVLAGKSGVVEGAAALDGRRQVLASLGVRHRPHLIRERAQLGAFLALQVWFDGL